MSITSIFRKSVLPQDTCIDTYFGFDREKTIFCASCKFTYKNLASFRTHMDRKHFGTVAELAPLAAGGDGIDGRNDSKSFDLDASIDDAADESRVVATLVHIRNSPDRSAEDIALATANPVGKPPSPVVSPPSTAVAAPSAPTEASRTVTTASSQLLNDARKALYFPNALRGSVITPRPVFKGASRRTSTRPHKKKKSRLVLPAPIHGIGASVSPSVLAFGADVEPISSEIPEKDQRPASTSKSMFKPTLLEKLVVLDKECAEFDALLTDSVSTLSTATVGDLAQYSAIYLENHQKKLLKAIDSLEYRKRSYTTAIQNVNETIEATSKKAKRVIEQQYNSLGRVVVALSKKETLTHVPEVVTGEPGGSPAATFTTSAMQK